MFDCNWTSDKELRSPSRSVPIVPKQLGENAIWICRLELLTTSIKAVSDLVANNHSYATVVKVTGIKTWNLIKNYASSSLREWENSDFSCIGRAVMTSSIQMIDCLPKKLNARTDQAGFALQFGHRKNQKKSLISTENKLRETSFFGCN